MRMFALPAICLMAGAMALSAQAAASPDAQTDLPVTAVTLYSSGVGYFEHAGVVHGDASAELHFKTSQINDVLKSLTLRDDDGGKVSTVSYPSQDPLAKTLHSFQVDITGNPGMAALLNQLRGARITVQVQTERISGTILGVEMRPKAVDKGDPVDQPVLNLLTGATIHSIDLATVTALTLDDARLQDELTRALGALSQARDQDKKVVTVDFTGTGARHVRIGYVVETPIWKTSYRLMLGDKKAALQGWAIVENETESDWKDVALSLVSGRPISFIMDLYQPLYLHRPTVIPQLFAGLRPQVYAGGLPSDRITQALALQPGTVVARNSLVPRDEVTTSQSISAGTGRFEDATITTGRSALGGVISMATAQQLGELFSYSIPHVTLARQKSAMLPIVTDTVPIERVSIYNATVLPRNPLNGVRFTNTTSKHLLQGPVTVLDQNAYAGDAQINDVPPGQKRLLSYGIDLDVTVDNTTHHDTATVVTATISKGALILDRRIELSQEYRIDNKGSRDKTIIIEHPISPGRKLVDSLEPIETTPTVYRFQKVAPAGKVSILTIREASEQHQTLTMLPADVGQLLTYSRTGEIPAKVRDAITKAIQLKQAVIDLDAQIGNRVAQIADITSEQDRIRENMKAVAPKTDYYNRLLSKLNDQESTIEKLQKERDDLQAKRDAANEALDDYLNGLTVGA
jgi:hypothetical protein